VTTLEVDAPRVAEIGTYVVLTDQPRRRGRVAGVPMATINLVTDTEQHQIATHGFDAAVCHRGARRADRPRRQGVRRDLRLVRDAPPDERQSLCVRPGRASIRSSATSAHFSVSGSTSMRLTTAPEASDSIAQTKCGRSMRFIVEQ
jgi:hypothetical protein